MRMTSLSSTPRFPVCWAVCFSRGRGRERESEGGEIERNGAQLPLSAYIMVAIGTGNRLPNPAPVVHSNTDIYTPTKTHAVWCTHIHTHWLAFLHCWVPFIASWGISCLALSTVRKTRAQLYEDTVAKITDVSAIFMSLFQAMLSYCQQSMRRRGLLGSYHKVEAITNDSGINQSNIMLPGALRLKWMDECHSI